MGLLLRLSSCKNDLLARQNSGCGSTLFRSEEEADVKTGNVFRTKSTTLIKLQTPRKLPVGAPQIYRFLIRFAIGFDVASLNEFAAASGHHQTEKFNNSSAPAFCNSGTACASPRSQPFHAANPLQPRRANQLERHACLRYQLCFNPAFGSHKHNASFSPTVFSSFLPPEPLSRYRERRENVSPGPAACNQ